MWAPKSALEELEVGGCRPLYLVPVYFPNYQYQVPIPIYIVLTPNYQYLYIVLNTSIRYLYLYILTSSNRYLYLYILTTSTRDLYQYILTTSTRYLSEPQTQAGPPSLLLFHHIFYIAARLQVLMGPVHYAVIQGRMVVLASSHT